MSAPALRFPEFDGEWEESRLGEISTKHDSGIYKNRDLYGSGHNIVGVSDLFGTNSIDGQIFRRVPLDEDELSKNSLLEGDILYAESSLVRAGIAKAVYVTARGAGTAFAWHTRRFSIDSKVADSAFIFYYLESSSARRYIESVATQTALTGITTKDYFQTPILLPHSKEQRKVAAFLGVVDAKIMALRDRQAGLERYKRGLMQALFSQRLRFTKPDGSAFPDWEEKQLGELATRSTLKNTELNFMRVLTNSAVRGVIDQADYFDKDIANVENLAGYYVLKKGDFVYNPRISVSAPVGPIKRNDLGDGVMSPLYTVFRFKEQNTEFYNAYFPTTFWHKYMKSVANYGARHDRMAITSGDLMKMPLPSPHPDEQQKIADALSAMDAKTEVVEDQLALMETFKKGLLQQMFV